MSQSSRDSQSLGIRLSRSMFMLGHEKSLKRRSVRRSGLGINKDAESNLDDTLSLVSLF